MLIHFSNCGCFKNLVDMECLMKQVQDLGISVSWGKECLQADIAILNTCGFISDSEDASLELIQEYVNKKKIGLVGQIWVMGCLSQKYGDTLLHRVPEIDRLYGNFNWLSIIRDLGGIPRETSQRLLTTPSHYAYIKISEGCSKNCSYCIKPIINGPLRSRPMEEILAECQALVSMGVKELQIVAQNTTDYGIDIYHRKGITELIRRISDIQGVEWIRIHYGYPALFPQELLAVIRERENVCNYLDMAIQHCSTKMLKLMRRHITKEELIQLLNEIRQEVPGIFLRTTLLVGHPGETKDDYEELCDFIDEHPFERMGVFAYSNQKGSYADKMYTDTLSIKEKQDRALLLIGKQKEIYERLNNAQIGNIERIIVDGCDDAYYTARTQHSTPFADPMVLIPRTKEIKIGQFYKCKLTKTLGKNMEGEIV